MKLKLKELTYPVTFTFNAYRARENAWTTIDVVWRGRGVIEVHAHNGPLWDKLRTVEFPDTSPLPSADAALLAANRYCAMGEDTNGKG